MPQIHTEKLADLIDKKHDCLAQLRDLGCRQLELAGQGDVTQLLRILSAKGHLISLLQSIEKELEPFRSEDPDARQWPSDAARRRCQRQAESCQQLLSEIVNQEKQSEGRLISRRGETAARLQGAHAATQARSAYQAPQTEPTGLLDLSSDQ